MTRSRLLKVLNGEPVSPIVVMVAPAGYGKTTLASQWAEATATRAAWLALTNEHNTPDRFLQGLLLAMDHRPTQPPTLDLAIEVVSRFGAGSNDCALIVDDYHVIENPEIHQLMSTLISNLPAGVRLLIGSRISPDLPLARLRMSGQVQDITITDLAFTENEIQELVQLSAVPTLSTADIKALVTRTDGWIAGIRLAMASASATKPADTTTIIDSWYARQSLDDFVLEEVLSSLSNELREFIMRTAFLPHLHPELCNYVLEITNSSALLDEATKQLAFIRPADGMSAELTYHRLFAESVSRLAERNYSPSERTSMHMRAAGWLEREGKWEEAFAQALRAEDWEAVIRYTRRICGELRQRDLSASRLHWLRKVPQEHLLQHGDLTRWLLTALLETGRVTEANAILQQVMPVWASSNDPQLLAYMHLTAAFTSILQGNDGQALRSLYTTLHFLPVEDHVERLHTWAAIMLLEFHRGNDSVADASYLQVQHARQHLPAEQGWIFTHVELTKTNQLALRGNLSEAIERYQDQAARQPAAFWHAVPNLQARMAALYLEQNRLGLAEDMAMQVERGLDAYPQQLWHTEAWLILARVYDALNDRARAREALNRARKIQETGGGWTLLLKIMATESWIALGEPISPITPHTNIVVDDQQPFRTAFFGELDPRSVKMAGLVVRGDIDLAGRLLKTLISDAVKTKRWAEVVQLAVWQVVIRLQSGDESGALESLKLALTYGRPGGFVRSFVTPGYDLTAFLQESIVHLDSDNARYIQEILRQNPWSMHRMPHDVATTLEDVSSLTARETEVLTLLATGESNKTISKRLFITERTVKKHVSNILQKLKVPSRTAAVARARAMGTLP